MQWEDVGFLKASKNRLKIFTILSESPRTPKELQELLNLHFSQVSFILKELTKRDLITCRNQKSRKGKIYSLSEKGEQIKKNSEKVI